MGRCVVPGQCFRHPFSGAHISSEVALAPMLSARCAFAAVATDNAIYAIGGCALRWERTALPSLENRGETRFLELFGRFQCSKVDSVLCSSFFDFVRLPAWAGWGRVGHSRVWSATTLRRTSGRRGPTCSRTGGIWEPSACATPEPGSDCQGDARFVTISDSRAISAAQHSTQLCWGVILRAYTLE